MSVCVGRVTFCSWFVYVKFHKDGKNAYTLVFGSPGNAVIRKRIAICCSVEHIITSAMTTDDSPSKDLVEDLQSFHISSPVRRRPNKVATAQLPDSTTYGNHLNVKQYVANNDFLDSKFLSYLGESNSKSYIRKLGDWSMNYGTVQQKSKSPSHGNGNIKDNRMVQNTGSNEDSSQSVDENHEPPQFKQYLQNNKPHAQQSQQLFRDPESELVLTASLNDISGIPTNTFKRHNHHNKKIAKENSNMRTGSDSITGLSIGTNYRVDAEYDEDKEEEEEEDIDPALEARGVFDNILRNQKSNYEFHQDKQLNKASDLPPSDEMYESDTTSSYFGETPSSLSPNVEKFSEKPPIDGIKLITPEEMGLVFDNVNGVWYKPPPKSQDISSSRTINNTTTGNSTDFTNSTTPTGAMAAAATANSIDDQPSASDKVEKKRSIATSATTKVGRTEAKPLHRIMKDNNEYSEKTEDIEDDTPLDAPQINPKFLLQGNKIKKGTQKSLLQMVDTTQNLIGNITTVSQVETSFPQSKRELISVLTDTIPPRRENWSQLLKIDLRNKNLNQIVGLNEILPKVIECDLSYNNLRGLQGVPPNTMTLDCQYNKITTSYCSLEDLPHLEILNLSHNSLSYNLSFLSTSTHLRDIDLSYNNIKSMEGDLGHSRIISLNLSHNNITGTIDFAKLVKYNKVNDQCAWANLQELNLSGNKIRCIKNISSLPNLRVLKLDGNPIEEIIEEEQDLPTSNNSLKTLTITNTMGALARICKGDDNQLPYHRLRILRTDSFPQMSQWEAMPRSLEELMIQNGVLEELPKWDILPNSLRSLTLTRIHGLKELPKSLAYQLPTLQELNVSYNQLESCYRLIQAIPTLCLVKLDIRHNPVVIIANENSTALADNQELIRALRIASPRLADLLV